MRSNDSSSEHLAEHPLHGGRITAGVVRVGDTSAASPAHRGISAVTSGHHVVCHHDPGPNNAVFRAGLPVAFIGRPRSCEASDERVAWSWREHAFTAANLRVFTAALGDDDGGRR